MCTAALRKSSFNAMILRMSAANKKSMALITIVIGASPVLQDKVTGMNNFTNIMWLFMYTGVHS